MQPLAARNKERGVGRAVEPAADARSRVLDDLLEVVEDDEAAAARGDRVTELDAGIALAEGHVEGDGDDEVHALERSRLGEVAEVDAARPVAEPCPAVATGQPGLAGAAGTGNGQQPRAGVEASSDGGEIGSPSDERIALARQGVAHLARGPPAVVAADDAKRLLGVVGRRKRRAVANTELEDLDRLGEPLQAIVAVTRDRHPIGRQCVADRGHGGRREQRLPATRERHDASRERLSDSFDLDRLGAASDLVGSVLAQANGADMQASARAKVERRERFVVGQREGGGSIGLVEEEEKAVAVVDLAAAVAGQERTRLPVVLGEDAGGTRVAQPLDDGGAVDQIGEEKRVAVHAIALRRQDCAASMR